MEKHYILALFFAVASAAAIVMANPSYAHLQPPLKNTGPAQFDARQREPAIAKRSVYFPSANLDLVSASSKMGKAPRTLRYCWEHAGNAANETHKQWIREALDETWNRLEVIRFADTGVCKPNASTPAESRLSMLRVALIDICRESLFYNRQRLVMLHTAFTAQCHPECAANAPSEKLCIKKIAVHEFGHALGLRHEHYRLDTPMVYNDDPCTMNSFRDQIAKAWFQKQNLLQPVGPWDEDSVMNLCSPGFFNFTNYRPLSLGDRSAILSLYGQTAYFNSSCNSRNSRQDPFSPACQSAVQRFCEKVLDGAPEDIVGVLRNVTTYGLNVTCFRADFIQRREQKRAESVALGIVRPATEPQVDAMTICQKWTYALDLETYNKKRFVGFSLDVGEDRPVTVCKESLWHVALGGNDMLEMPRKLNDSHCQEQLPLMVNGNEHYPLSCVALVDYYCEIHRHGAGGVILKLDKQTAIMEIGCFQPILKTELFSYLD